MKIEFDPVKSERNVVERGLPFDLVAGFDWSTLRVEEDLRQDYPERRFIEHGLVAGRLHALCYTPIAGGIRVISFRKANARERKRYAQAADE